MNTRQQWLESGYFVNEGVLAESDCRELLAAIFSSSNIRRGRVLHIEFADSLALASGIRLDIA